jgi:hypothetical protein
VEIGKFTKRCTMLAQTDSPDRTLVETEDFSKAIWHRLYVEEET